MTPDSYFKGKLRTCLMGPYEVDDVFDNGTIDETCTSLLVNGHHLKIYHCPTSKDAFIKNLSNNSGLMVFGAENALFAL